MTGAGLVMGCETYDHQAGAGGLGHQGEEAPVRGPLQAPVAELQEVENGAG